MKKLSLAVFVLAILVLAGAGCVPSYQTPSTNAPQTGTPTNSSTGYPPTNTVTPPANTNVYYPPTNTNVVIPPPVNVNQPVPTTMTIDIRNFAFNPAQLTVRKGTTVTWTNYDSVTHKIAGSGFGSNPLNQGDSYSYTFTAAGTYDYHCAIHTFMTGTITVQ